MDISMICMNTIIEIVIGVLIAFFIKGIYNIVSLTGGDAIKAKGAIYQLSQAIASGVVKAADKEQVIRDLVSGL